RLPVPLVLSASVPSRWPISCGPLGIPLGRWSRRGRPGCLRSGGARRSGRTPGGGGERLWPPCVSRIGWAQQTRPYAGERGALALLPIACGAALVALAIVLAR